MQIVTDRGADLTPEQLEGLNVYFAPLIVTLDGKTYRSGVDIQSDEFLQKLEETEAYPTTSQPSAGDFAALYRKLAETDPEILSIHISSGLSGTLNAARAGAAMVPEAHVTFFDTKTLSCPEGWHVEAAARAAKAGWSMEKTLALLERIRAATEGMFTITTMKYLIHGGRVSHLKGLVASLLNIKPVIGVAKDTGMYITLGQEMTLRRAIQKLVDVVQSWYPTGSSIRIQLLHANNLAGIEQLGAKLSELFDVTFIKPAQIGPVLAAHTGAGLVGLSVAPQAIFDELA
ncbi:MAG: DegV family protein [Anaerolineaceae bacterium]